MSNTKANSATAADGANPFLEDWPSSGVPLLASMRPYLPPAYEQAVAHRLLLHLLTILLTALLVAQPVEAYPSVKKDVAYAAKDGSVQPAKQINHASKRQRYTVSLEDFSKVDDDVQQYFKPPPILVREPASVALAAEAQTSLRRVVRPTHRACAAYSTGPPHA